jgi:hypothetical protein
MPLGFVPTLHQEAKASITGYKALKAAGATAQELQKARKNLSIAFGTYLGAATIPAVLTHYFLNKKKEK